MQEQASNRPVLLRSKGVVVSDRGKVILRGWQVRIEKMSESKPSEDASLLPQDTVKTGTDHWFQEQSGRHLIYGPDDSRCIGGMISIQALVWNVRTLFRM